MRSVAWWLTAAILMAVPLAEGCGRKAEKPQPTEGISAPRVETEKTVPEVVPPPKEPEEAVSTEAAPTKEGKGAEGEAGAPEERGEEPDASSEAPEGTGEARGGSGARLLPSIPEPGVSSGVADKPVAPSAKDRAAVVNAVKAKAQELAPGGPLAVSEVRIAGEWALVRASVSRQEATYVLCRKRGGEWVVLGHGSSAAELAEEAGTPGEARAALGIR